MLLRVNESVLLEKLRAMLRAERRKANPDPDAIEAIKQVMAALREQQRQRTPGPRNTGRK